MKVLRRIWWLWSKSITFPIERVIQKLSNKGIKASPEDKMKKVASALNTTPLELEELIKKVN